ncbi:TIGR03915 family putative DNA repair protein [Ramlibacter albus]|uniref:TIGR03915 family putative DNA repair protein n=1 Tax=Ramlibacter albus TaxID=2079448 RepID=A0A923M6T9_9BURK|nr:TIGR03915 family putative DNA repair protein [Ramlibacter albus]MBC5763784.1 TIGR03915 family putative DNA repair protein [Ramlibacter albus]
MKIATQAHLAGETDLAGFRAESRELLAQQVHPDNVQWQMGRPAFAELFTAPLPAAASRPKGVPRAASAIVPASFLRLCESVVLHRDPERFGLLYRLLWRLVHEPDLRNDPADPDMMRAQHMAHAVRRDIHKMKTYLRFQPLDQAQVAYYEPSHHVLEAVAPWFLRRYHEQPWAIFTPERSVRFDGQKLLFAPGMARERVPKEADSAGWLTCLQDVFRPAPAA